MKRLLIMLLLPVAGAAFARSETVAMPTATDVAAAHSEYEAEPCMALIDVCESGPGPTEAEAIQDLSCRPARAGAARCRFRVAYQLCRARFVRQANAAGPGWAIARGSSRGPIRVRVTCREIGD